MADTGNYPSEWDISKPTNAETRVEGGENIRHVKAVVTNVTAKVDGSPVGDSLLSLAYPIGSLSIQDLDPQGNPGDDVGGTWQLYGRFDINLEAGGTKEIFVYRRTS